MDRQICNYDYGFGWVPCFEDKVIGNISPKGWQTKDNIISTEVWRVTTTDMNQNQRVEKKLEWIKTWHSGDGFVNWKVFIKSIVLNELTWLPSAELLYETMYEEEYALKLWPSIEMWEVINEFL